MQKSSFNKLSILLFIIVILSSCNKDNGIEEISESYIEIKVLRISKDNTKTPIYNAIAYIYYDIAPIDLANYTDKGNDGIYLMKIQLYSNFKKNKYRWLSRNKTRRNYSFYYSFHP